jgi:hypothetical protein
LFTVRRQAERTTHVRKNMRDGDIVVDLDAMAAAMTFKPEHHHPLWLLTFLLPVRESIFKQLDAPNEAARVWIIGVFSRASELEALKQRFNARIVRMDTPRDECVRRLNAQTDRPRRDESLAAIDAWFASAPSTSTVTATPPAPPRRASSWEQGSDEQEHVW